MRIIVTGASGFVGKNLLLAFPKDWQITALFFSHTDFLSFLKGRKLRNVKPYRADLREEVQVKNLFKQAGNDFDLCVYLSAKVDIPSSVADPLTDLEFNVKSLLNFLNYFQGKRFIYLSSGAVYDGLVGKVNPDANLNPTLPYAISKYTGELYVKSYHQRRRSFNNYVILRFFGAFGPYEPQNKIFTKLVTSLYFKKDKSFTIYGDGKNLIDAMYIEDAVQGILKVIKSKKENLTLDFARGEPLSIEKLVKKTAKILGRDGILIKKEGIAHEHNLFYADPKRMSKVFGFNSEISYEEGIRKFIAFLEKENPST